MRREEAERVVAPVVDQPALRDSRLGDEVVHRQQLHGGHPEVGEVVDDRRRGQAGVRPAQLLGHPVVQGGHALDVHLVDHRVAVAPAHRPVVSPVEVVVDDDAARDVRRGVGVVALLRRTLLVAVDRGMHAQPTRDRAGVGIEQQLGRVEPQAAARVPRTVGAEAVAGAGRDVRERAVPDAQRLLGEGMRGLVARVVEQAHPDGAGLRGVDGEVRRLLRPGGPQGMVATRPDLRGLALVLPGSRGHGRHCCRCSQRAGELGQPGTRDLRGVAHHGFRGA